MQFHFRLAPVDEIIPWGADSGRPSLHWYGLTDGWFWIEVGGQELFRYTTAALARWAQQDPDFQPGPLPYTNYPVVRYWEDLLELLPAVLDPLPADLATQITDAQNWDDWQRAALQWQEAQADEAAWDTYYTALRWWGARTWNAGHLAHPPRLMLWRAENTVHVRWDNSSLSLNGTPVWEAQQGEIALPVTEFLAAVESFHHRFLSTMELRVREAATGWARPEVEIDPAALLREQEDRLSWLTAAIDPRTAEARRDFSWNDVRAAMKTIDQALA